MNENNNQQFDFRDSPSYKIVKSKKWFKNFAVRILKLFLYFIFLYLITNLILNLLGFLYINESLKSIYSICCSLIIVVAIIDIYLNWQDDVEPKIKLSEAINSQKVDIAQYFENDAMLQYLEVIKLRNKYDFMNLNAVTFFMSLYQTNVGFMLLLRSQILLNTANQEEFLRSYVNNKSQSFITDDLARVFNIAIENAIKDGRTIVDLADIFLGLSKDPILQKIFSDLQLREADILDIISWHRRFTQYSKKEYVWNKKYYGVGIGQDWASGYTPLLNIFAKDISQYLTDVKLQAIARGHKAVIGQIEETLVKSSRNNVMLVGEAGVGKQTLVNAFAQKVARGESLEQLRYRHVIELDVGRLMVGADSIEIQNRFSQIFDEITHAGNIILYINNFDNLVNPNPEQLGTVDASQFLIPYLESDRLQIVANCSFDGWHKKIETNQTLANLFTKINVVEPDKEEMMPVLEDSVAILEVKHNITFTYLALKKIIVITDRYVHDVVFPQKAIDLAQSISVRKSQKNNLSIVTDKDIETYASGKYNVPTEEVGGEEKSKLLNLEGEFHKRIIDQEEAINLISNALRRARTGLAKKDKPIGSFLFIGPTGVGKTETAKALAEIYFGNEKDMIRFDMSEYQDINTIERLIGTSNTQGEANQGRLSIAIRENPYTVLLFDEIEKAHPNILNLFLQILDEGYLTDATGRKLDFTNSIIISTSNAGANEIRKYLQDKKPLDKLSSYILDFLQQNNIFKPEFLNRFDAVVCFKPLLPEHILAIANIMIEKLKLVMQEKNISLQVSNEAVQKLAELGYDPLLGARPMRRTIQEKLENLLAKKMLSGEINKGQQVIINEQDIV